MNSTRGNIYDRNGELLADNELAYSITIEDNGSYSSTDKKNESLNLRLPSCCTEKTAMRSPMILRLTAPEGYLRIQCTGTSLKRFLADVFGESSYDDLGMNKKLGYDTSQATVDQVMDYLSNDCYGIDDSYSDEMAFRSRSCVLPWRRMPTERDSATTIATNVSEESVAYISEHAQELQGVEVMDDTIRKYNNSEYFASILGYTGKISSEEYANYPRRMTVIPPTMSSARAVLSSIWIPT